MTRRRGAAAVPSAAAGRVFVAGLAAYVLAIFAIKGFVHAGAIGHDADQLLLSQSFALGYDDRNPPLYTWLVIAAQSLLGVGLPAVAAVKAGLIFATYFLLHRAARLVLGDDAFAVMAALAPVAMYQMGFWMAAKYSHSVLLVAVAAATLYVLLRLEATGKTSWYAALGLTLGLGLLAKYNYSVFAGALIGAALLDPDFRARLRDPRIGLSAVLAVLVALPHAQWMAAHMGDFEGVAAARMGVGAGGSGLYALGRGLAEAVQAMASFTLPLLLLVPALAWRARRLQGTAAAWPGRRHFRLLGRALLIMIAAVLLLVAASGATRVRTQYMFVLLPLPLWIAAWMQGLDVSRRAVRGCTAALAALAFLTPAWMLGAFLAGPGAATRPDNASISYAALAADLRRAGFEGGTIFANDYPYNIAGNLRPYFPAARVASRQVAVMPPDRSTSGQCLRVWAVDLKSVDDAAMTAISRLAFGPDGGAPSTLAASEVPVVNGGGRRLRFAYRLFPGGAGRCR